MRIVLASGSPRRLELLRSLGLDFEVVPADIDETPHRSESPEALVKRLSISKASAVAASHPDALVIAADTVVVHRRDILGKPDSDAENRTFIRRLSGQTHHVYTGHALVYGTRSEVGVRSTKVTFRRLRRSDIDWYVGTGEGRDKAGGYAIQGYGATLVEGVEGCYFNVVGLSLVYLVELCRALGVELVGSA